MLLAGAELMNFLHDGGEQVIGRERAVTAKGSGETFFAEFIVGFVKGFSDAVGVESENGKVKNVPEGLKRVVGQPSN